MTSGLRTIIYPVKDLDRVKETYCALLGVAPHTESPYYVGFRVDEQEIGLDPNGHEQGMIGPVGYWHVDDLEGTLARLVDAGVVAQPPRDVGGGKRIATVEDPDGNVIGLIQAP